MTAAQGRGAEQVPTEPLLVPAADQVVRYNLLPDGDVEGTRRGVANGLAGASCMVNVLEMPPHQASPTRRFNGEHIVFQLSGTVIWTVDGVDYPLSAGDMLFVPVDRPYSFRNVGDELGRFVDIAGKVEDWPPSMFYADGRQVASASMGELFN